MGERSSLPLRLYYAAMFAALGAYLPYFPRWLETRGVQGVAMGAVTSLMPALGIVGPPLFGLLADALGLRGRVLAVACLGAAVPFAVIAFFDRTPGGLGLPALFAWIAVYAFFRSPMTMMADVVALERERAHGDAYGKNRLWGSLGFLVTALVVGDRLDVTAPSRLPTVIAVALFAAFAAALLLPARAPVPPRPLAGAGRAIARTPSFLLFLAVSFLAQVAHSSYDLCSTLHLHDLGRSERFAGIWWSAGVVFEIALMAFAAPLLRRASPPFWLAIGLAGACMRWALLARVTSPVALLLVQPLHAFSFGLVWLSSVAYLRERVAPAVASTAQGLFTAAVGLGSVAGMFVWAPLYAANGGRAVFAAATGVGACALGAAVLFARRAGRTPVQADLGQISRPAGR